MVILSPQALPPPLPLPYGMVQEFVKESNVDGEVLLDKRIELLVEYDWNEKMLPVDSLVRASIQVFMYFDMFENIEKIEVFHNKCNTKYWNKTKYIEIQRTY